MLGDEVMKTKVRLSLVLPRASADMPNLVPADWVGHVRKDPLRHRAARRGGFRAPDQGAGSLRRVSRDCLVWLPVLPTHECCGCKGRLQAQRVEHELWHLYIAPGSQ